MSDSLPLSSSAYPRSPKYWWLWLLLGGFYLISRLPLPAQHFAGRIIGFVLYWFGPKRRHIARVNLQLCFPDWTKSELENRLKNHFALYGISLVESFTAWWGKASLFHNRVEYRGLEHLQNALDQQKGVLLLSGHFTTLEIGLRLLGQKIPFEIMYRRHKNPLFEKVMSDGRERWVGKTHDRKAVRDVLKSLKHGHAIWYGPDQDYGRKHSVFAPFFNIPAATVTATSRWAKLSGAAVVPYFVERQPGNRYCVYVLPALDHFPSKDLFDDATRLNQIFETEIMKAPENYLWTHRRFKTRPEGEARPY